MVKYNDYPLAECAATLEPLVAKGCTFHQKWTCAHCKSRQTMGEANKLFTSGECEACGKTSKIAACNYLLIGSGEVMLPAMLGKETK